MATPRSIAVVVLLLVTLPTLSRAATIDFETLAPGSNLATINAEIASLGASFTGVNPGAIFTDPNNASNEVFRAFTSFPGGDVVLNFTAPVISLSVQFIDNPDGSLFTVAVRALDGNVFDATLFEIGGEKAKISNGEQAEKITSELPTLDFSVTRVEKKVRRRKPAASTTTPTAEAVRSPTSLRQSWRI